MGCDFLWYMLCFRLWVQNCAFILARCVIIITLLHNAGITLQWIGSSLKIKGS